jgi:hypothetical protein
MLCNCIRQVPNLSINKVTRYPKHWNGFRKFIQVNNGKVLEIAYDYTLQNSVLHIIYDHPPILFNHPNSCS